ncbi:hypothetical protein B0T24DRAFT_716661 [Lasiosphaeria ovina]|uniref:Uncharacterized protein n=1 Tax=Lasiosphaeria ovina TaxID=92902 RepID=A0AAE0KMK0_9PEZI|nr:hypothetical protein B0T24DRAFT_716661 [Lasiosphaeria ovina]
MAGGVPGDESEVSTLLHNSLPQRTEPGSDHASRRRFRSPIYNTNAAESSERHSEHGSDQDFGSEAPTNTKLRSKLRGSDLVRPNLRDFIISILGPSGDPWGEDAATRALVDWAREGRLDRLYPEDIKHVDMFHDILKLNIVPNGRLFGRQLSTVHLITQSSEISLCRNEVRCRGAVNKVLLILIVNTGGSLRSGRGFFVNFNNGNIVDDVTVLG